MKKTSFFLALLLAFSMLFNITAQADEKAIVVKRNADVVFIIDNTGSMGDNIDGVKKNLSTFIKSLKQDGVDVRVGFVIFGDITIDEKTESSGWFKDEDQALSYLENVKIRNGGDSDETLYDGIGEMLDSFSFRDIGSTARMAIILTDADTKVNNTHGLTSDTEISNKLKDKKINTSFITSKSYFDSYEPLRSKDGGKMADIDGDYAVILEELKDVVIDSTKRMHVFSIYPQAGLVNTPQVVNVDATLVQFDEEFNVTVGGENASDITKTDRGFSFKVPTDLSLGSYDIKVKNGKGNDYVVIGKYRYVDKEEEADYKILGISPSSSEAGKEQKVKVDVDHIKYSADFKLKFGSYVLETTNRTSTGFEFIIPASMNAGKYNVVVSNGSEKYAGRYTLTKAPEPPFSFTLSQSSSQEDTEVNNLKISFNRSIEYSGDFSIKLGDTTLEPNRMKMKPGYVYTSIPAGIKAGGYSLTVTNNGTSASAPYTITAKPPEPGFSITLSQTSSVEGTAVDNLKIKFNRSLEFGKDFSIKLGDTALRPNSAKWKPGYVYTSIPAGIKAGGYSLTVTNNGTSASAPYTITAKPPEPGFSITLSQTSSVEGTAVDNLKIKFSRSLEFGKDFSIKLGDTDLRPNSAKWKPGYVYTSIPGTVKAGNLKITVTNNGRTASADYTINPKTPVVDPPFSITLSQTSSDEGAAVDNLKIKFSRSLEFGKDFSIKLGDTDLRPNSAKWKPGYVYTSIPGTVKAGNLKITVTNNGRTASADYTINPKKPVFDPPFSITLSQTSSDEGAAVDNLKIKFSRSLEFGKDFSIKLGDTALQPNLAKWKPGYVYTSIPGTVKAGNLKITVTNNGRTASADYTINPKPPVFDPPFSITLSQTSSDEGTAVDNLKIKFSRSLEFGKDFSIKLGDTALRPNPAKWKPGYVYTSIPGTVKAGNLKITVTNNGRTASADYKIR